MIITKKTVLTAATVSLTMLCACNADNEEFATPLARRTIIANADLATGQSRSAIDPRVYADGAVGILWTPDDAIGVFSASENNVEFKNEADAPVGRTGFTGTMSDEPLYAYYPYSALNAGASADALKGNLPLEQTYDETDMKISGDWKYGAPRAGAPDEFDFKHMFSLFRFTVNATGTDMQGETLDKVVLELPEERTLGGDFTFSAVTGEYNMPHTDGSNILTMEWTADGTLAQDRSLTGYISCAPDIKADDDVTVKVFTTKRVATFTAKAAYDFEGSSIYSFDLNLAELAKKYDVTIEDLPEEETANCYMITTAGEHDFKATVIGNGAKGIIPGAGFHTEDPYINPKAARLLWEDVDGFVTDVKLINGRVHYTTSGNRGNAVIAVYDNATASGDILWSWHIWGVGDTMPGDVEVTNYNGAVFNVMDRSRGALSMTSVNVMLYQWGRKDPFPNADTYYVDGKAVDIEQSYPVFDGGEVTLTTFVRNPDKLATLPYTESTRYLWGDNNITDAYTFKWPNYLGDATAEQTSGWTDQKTIYDPSPVGYRVSPKFAWTGFLDHKMATNASVSSNYRIDYVNYVKYDQGYYFKRNAADTEGIYFPQSGSRGAATGTLWVGGNAPYKTVGYTASYWSSAPQKNDGYAQSLSMTPYYDGNGSVVENSRNAVNALDFAYIQNAFAVRCVRE